MNYLNLPVLVVVWVAGRRESARRSYWLAFGLGLLTDLLTGYQLGTMAAAYLLAAGLVYLFKSRFPLNPGVLVVFLIISQVVFYYARGI